MKKRVIILGSTGSIGRNTIDVVQSLSDQWEVVGLAAGSRSSELAEQANRFRPEAVALACNQNGANLTDSLNYAPSVFSGPTALEDLVSQVECDCVVTAVVGVGGISATLRAAELGRRIALANKEAMVVAGAVLIPTARRSGATIIPVDSEHSAILQALQSGTQSQVRRVFLTASGGPFRTWTREAIGRATVEDALAHPTWCMGPKITIDSATMMNKALEIIEAKWLFDLSDEQIEVIVHPESIIHSMVEFCDGSVMAQMGAPDMRTPIQYALSFPDRVPGPSDSLDFAALTQLTFDKPDFERFPALRLGFEVARLGGTSGAVLNAANEEAVQLFRDGAISFPEITQVVERALDQHTICENPTLAELLSADRWAREEVKRCVTC